MPLANIGDNTPDNERNEPPSLEAPNSKMSNKQSIFCVPLPVDDLHIVPFLSTLQNRISLANIISYTPDDEGKEPLSLEAPPSKKATKVNKV